MLLASVYQKSFILCWVQQTWKDKRGFFVGDNVIHISAHANVNFAQEWLH
jgi:hypothetical protein